MLTPQSAQQPWRLAPAVSTSGRCRDSRELAGSAVTQSAFTQVRSHCGVQLFLGPEARPVGIHLPGKIAFLQGWEDVRYAERVDPFTLVKAEIDSVSERLRRGILSGIPVLERAAEYFFKVRRRLLWDSCECIATLLPFLGLKWKPGARQRYPVCVAVTVCALASLAVGQLCSLVRGPRTAATSTPTQSHSWAI